MKQLFFVFFLLPLGLYAQDCKLNTETDPFTKQTKISTGFIYVDGGSISFDADSKEIIVLLNVDGADKCFDDQAMCYINFEGTKVKLTVRNSGTMNCEGLLQFVYRNQATVPSALQKMVTQKISQITIVPASKKEVYLKFSPGDQDHVLKLGGCLLEEAKKLIVN